MMAFASWLAGIDSTSEMREGASRCVRTVASGKNFNRVNTMKPVARTVAHRRRQLERVNARTAARSPARHRSAASGFDRRKTQYFSF
jgi:hypothetical protein